MDSTQSCPSYTMQCAVIFEALHLLIVISSLCVLFICVSGVCATSGTKATRQQFFATDSLMLELKPQTLTIKFRPILDLGGAAHAIQKQWFRDHLYCWTPKTAKTIAQFATKSQKAVSYRNKLLTLWSRGAVMPVRDRKAKNGLSKNIYLSRDY